MTLPRAPLSPSPPFFPLASPCLPLSSLRLQLQCEQMAEEVARLELLVERRAGAERMKKATSRFRCMLNAFKDEFYEKATPPPPPPIPPTLDELCRTSEPNTSEDEGDE